MADSKLSGLPAAGSALAADEIEVNEAGTSKKITVTQLFTNPALAGYADIAAIASPSAPSTGYSRIFVKDQAGRPMPAFMGPSGLDSLLMPHLAKNGWSSWKPTYTGTTISAIGNAALSATGTATSAPYATTSIYTRSQKVEYLVTTGATSAVAGYRSSANWRTNEGFHMIFRVCPATGVSTSGGTSRCFAGMVASTSAPTDVNPSTLVNVAGVGYDSTDSNWQFITNNASGTAAKVDTGLARPVADRENVFTVQVFAPPGGAWVGVSITDELNSVYYGSGQLSADIPVTTTALCCKGYHSVGGTSSVTGLALFSGWIDTDN